MVDRSPQSKEGEEAAQVESLLLYSSLISFLLVRGGLEIIL